MILGFKKKKMNNEKMLEYLMISEILNTTVNLRTSPVYNWLYPRYSELRDEFIKEYTPTIPNIKNPVTDNNDKESS